MVGAILNSTMPSCERGAGTISREAASLPLAAVSKLAAVLWFPAESAWVATAADMVGAILNSTIPSCGRAQETFHERLSRSL